MSSETPKFPLKTGRTFCFTWKVEGSPDTPDKILPEDSEYIYQKEQGKGENSYVHWQGYIRFAKNITPVALKKIWAPIHWENRRKKHKDAYKYCMKEEGRLEEPVIHNMTAEDCSGKRNDLSDARELVIKHGNYRDCVNDPSLDEVRAKYPGWIKELLASTIIPDEDFKPREWQQELLDMLIEPCTDDRTVHWYYDEIGKSGKTVFGKYLVTNHKALYLTNGKTADAACIYDGHPIVVFNYTRSQSTRINYEVLEMLKDGILMSGKYQPIQKVTNSPHVIVFANFRPDESMLSADRWNIVDMSSKKRKRLELVHQGRKVFKGSYVNGFTPSTSVPAEMEVPKFFIDGGAVVSYPNPKINI